LCRHRARANRFGPRRWYVHRERLIGVPDRDPRSIGTESGENIYLARKNPNPNETCVSRNFPARVGSTRDSAQSGSSGALSGSTDSLFSTTSRSARPVSRRLARRSTRGGCRADDRHANDPSALRSSVRAARDHGVDDAERRRPARGRDALARATRRHASRPARVAPRRAVRGGGGGPPGRADRDRADGRVPPEVRRRSNSGPPGARKDARSVPPPATPTHQTKPSSIFSDVSVKDGCTGKSAIDESLR
jgi:hypothetical protein